MYFNKTILGTLFSLAMLLPVCFVAQAASASTEMRGLASTINAITKSSEAYHMLPTDFQRSKKIIFATNPAYPPTTYRDAKSGKMQGLAIDLTNAVAKKLGVKVEYRDSTGSGYIPGILSGRYDAAVANIGDYKEREEKADFVNYAKTFITLIVRKKNPASIETLNDFCGKTFAVLQGSVSVRVLKRISKIKCDGGTININQLETDAEAQLQVLSGRADGDLLDTPAAIYSTRHTSGGGKLEVVDTIPDLRATWVGYAVSKETPALSKAIQQALAELKTEGIYKKIFKAWGLQEMMIDNFYINAGTEHPLEPKVKP